MVGIWSALGCALPVGEGSLLGSNYSISEIIQMDALIIPGNSGGYLVN